MRTMPMSVLLHVIAFVAVSILQTNQHNVLARTWDSIVDTSLYSAALMDPYRDMGKVYNPNSTTSTTIPAANAVTPTTTPTSYPISTIVDTPPSILPTMVPSSSSVPTTTLCSDSDETNTDTVSVPVKIKLYDSWGDGWGDTKMIIAQPNHNSNKNNNTVSSTTSDNSNTKTTYDSFMSFFTNTQTTTSTVVTTTATTTSTVFEGTLVDGNEDVINVCLQTNICYTIEVNGTQNEWQNEIQWDIRQPIGPNATLLTIAKGYAPTKCQFSLPDSFNGSYVCDLVCEHDKTLSEDGSTSKTVSPSHSTVPSTISSNVPSSSYHSSDYPSTISSTIPSRVVTTTTAIPTSPSSGGSVLLIIDTPPTAIPSKPSSHTSHTNHTTTTSKSLQPSLIGSAMVSGTVGPTKTFQPTKTVHPTSDFNVHGIVLNGGESDANATTNQNNDNDDGNAVWVDDDLFLHPPSASVPTTVKSPSVSKPAHGSNHSPIRIPVPTKVSVTSVRSDTITVQPTTQTANPTSYGADFMTKFMQHHSSSSSISSTTTILDRTSSLETETLDDNLQFHPTTVSATVSRSAPIPSPTTDPGKDIIRHN
jgi:hypothetical protein